MGTPLASGGAAEDRKKRVKDVAARAMTVAEKMDPLTALRSTYILYEYASGDIATQLRKMTQYLQGKRRAARKRDEKRKEKSSIPSHLSSSSSSKGKSKSSSSSSSAPLSSPSSPVHSSAGTRISDLRVINEATRVACVRLGKRRMEVDAKDKGPLTIADVVHKRCEDGGWTSEVIMEVLHQAAEQKSHNPYSLLLGVLLAFTRLQLNPPTVMAAVPPSENGTTERVERVNGKEKEKEKEKEKGKEKEKEKETKRVARKGEGEEEVVLCNHCGDAATLVVSADRKKTHVITCDKCGRVDIDGKEQKTPADEEQEKEKEKEKATEKEKAKEEQMKQEMKRRAAKSEKKTAATPKRRLRKIFTDDEDHGETDTDDEKRKAKEKIWREEERRAKIEKTKPSTTSKEEGWELEDAGPDEGEEIGNAPKAVATTRVSPAPVASISSAHHSALDDF